MFPTGVAGIALIVLRSVVAVTVIADTSRRAFLSSVAIIDIFVALIGLCLCLGFLTPYCAALSCLLEITFLAAGATSNHLQMVMSALTASAQAALGPGAYSLDARLFGRQLIKIPPKPDSR
jgi:hypothetical protein